MTELPFQLGLLALIVALCTLLLTAWLVRFAPRIGLIDRPNERSSHARLTPRGGGIAIVLVSLVAIAVATDLTKTEAIAIIPAVGLVALVGLIDDFIGTSPWIRIAAHCVSAGWFLVWVGGSTEVGIHWLDRLPLLRDAVVGVSLIWFLNAFNFMDGIDGIAASEGVFIAAGVFLFAASAPPDSALLQFAAIIGGACVGFLLMNWSPARIFMGDVGSGSLGLLIGCLLVVGWSRGTLSPWSAATLASLFLADATTTLLRRIYLGELWYMPHRSHAYQRLARRLGSHSRATVAFMAFNVLCLGPVAWAIQAGLIRSPAPTWIAAFLATSLAAFCLGAGRRE